MKKIKISIFIGLISTLILFAGCTKEQEPGRKTIEKGNKKITVILDKNHTVGEDVVDKIQVYEKVKGYGWLEDNEIFGIIEDEKIEKEIQDEVYDLRNIPFLKEKIVSPENLPYGHINISPDKKKVFYVNEARQIGYILNLKGKIKASVKGLYASELSEAIWVNNEELVMPDKGTGFYIININGKETKIEDVENEENISKAIKLGNRIYYTTQNELDRKMKVYDISTKEKKLFIEDRVMDFHLSLKGNEFILETSNLKEDKNSLLLVDLEGKNKDVVAEGRMIYGTSLSHDGSKLAYIVNSRGEGEEGLFLIDLEKNKRNQLSTSYLDIETELKWNPSGNKIMINAGEVKEGKWLNKTHVITLK
ncbi:hypothetical protein [Oceanirhabdus sp. W0125-5]|uniref:hypothetical protein n=1 Tax=Oceanirhabdus sp. W0125-5 TaxID=2999116 RepID=UPI0022F3053D|nr:hypothetical protein [Oceanirhabdus sp. W0125-5]WBW97182.1 hypothetical protein OW730_26360 [Oceanirhabdus sp. W0125-5]